MFSKWLLRLLICILPVNCYAADSTVSSLSAASALSGTELYYCIQSGDKKCTTNQILTFVTTSPTITNPTITGSFTATGLVTNGALANPATTVNGQTCTLGSTCTVTAAATGITVGTTTVGSGTNTRILYDNSGTLGEYTITGSGTVVAMQTSPTFVTDLTTPIAKLSGTSNQLVFQSAGVTGTLSWAPASTNKTITLPNGTTDFTGTSGIVQQASSGAAFTVGSVALTNIAAQATNTIVGNATSGSAAPTALAIGTCSTASSALIWTTNTGFGCNTSITANAVAVGGITGLGTGVATALGVNIGSAGAFVTFNGALGTPSSGVATNLTGTASGLTAGNVTTNANLTGVITSVGNATSIASQTGTGTKFVVDTSPVLVTPTLGVATATSINGNTITSGTGTLTLTSGAVLTASTTTSVGRGQYLGESTTGNATAGNIGEEVISTIASGSAVSLTNATDANLTTISLTAGDWDIWAQCYFGGGTTTNLTIAACSINTTTATMLTTAPNLAVIPSIGAVFNNAYGFLSTSITPIRKSISGTTSYFLNCRGDFTVSTLNCFGTLRARRMR